MSNNIQMSVINREDLTNKTPEEIQKYLESDLVQFSEEISNLTIDELKALEEKLMEIFKSNDEYLSKVSYNLQTSVEYDGETYMKSYIIDAIISFINRIEVDFRATLGIYQAIKFWKTKVNESIPYGVFDSTLRMLGTLKFKGERDCRDILIVNNWFAGAHKQYLRDNVYTNYLASKHQALMDRMNKLTTTDDSNSAYGPDPGQQ